jgi:gliding motility-associated lipoprotein GldH
MSIPTGCIDREHVAICSVRDISASRWTSADSLTWSLSADSLERFAMEVSVRHGYGYRYRNLGLELSVAQGDTLVSRDTVELTLANADGTWLGSGWGSMLEVTAPLPSFTAPRSAQYTLSIRPCMQSALLHDVMAVGIKAVRE